MTSRRVVDLAFVGVMAACAYLFVTRARIPELPDGVCAETDGSPRLPARATVAAVFATIEGPDDVTGWSMRTLADELRALGFVERGRVLARGDATVELIGPLPDDAGEVEGALNRALETADLVYYNGHHFGGDLDLHGHGGIAFLDTCYSTQLYAELRDQTQLIGNREKAITGSVYGFVDVLAALLARDGRSWQTLLAPINAAAIRRAALRDVYPEPERYGLVGRCQGQAPADEP